MGQQQSSAAAPPPVSVLQGHTLQFSDGGSWETQQFFERNLMHIALGRETTVGTYSSRQAPNGDILYQYIPIGKDGVYTGRIYTRRGQPRLDLSSERRQLRGEPCFLTS